MTRWNVNIAFVLATLIGTPAVAGGIALLHHWQCMRLADSLLELARHEEQAGKWLKAAEVLERYLQIQPRDAQVQSRLALNWANGARTPEECQRAIEMSYRALSHKRPVQAGEVRSRLAELLLESNRLFEAEQEAQRLLGEEPGNPLAGRVRAIARFAQFQNGVITAHDDYQVSILQIVEEARKVNPTDVALAEVAATIYRNFPELVRGDPASRTEEERWRRADACLDLLVENSPDTPAAYLARFRYRKRYNLEGASDDLERALESSPMSPEVLLTTAKTRLQEAESLVRDGAFKDAQHKFFESSVLYRKIVDGRMFPGRVEPHLGLGDSLRGLADFDRALDAWRAGLRCFEQPSLQIHLYMRIADCLLEQKKLEDAHKALADIDHTITKLGASVTNVQRAALRRGQNLRWSVWHVLHREPLKAIPLLQQVIALDSKGSHDLAVTAFAWKQLGRSYGMLEEWDQAAVAFDCAVAANPNDTRARLAAAEAWLRADRPELAIDRAEAVVSANTSFEAWLSLAAAQYRHQLKQPPKEQSWERFEDTLVALKRFPSTTAPLWRVTLLEAEYRSLPPSSSDDNKSHLQPVVEVLHQGTQQHSDVEQFWAHAVVLYQILGLKSEADHALTKLRALGQSETQIAIATARQATLRKQYSSAAHTLGQALRVANDSDRAMLKRELFYVAEVSGDQQALASLLKSDLPLSPSDIGLLRRLALGALKQRDFENLAYYEKQLAKCGTVGDFWSRYYRIWRSVHAPATLSEISLRQAFDAQQQLASKRPALAGLLVLRAALEQRKREANDTSADDRRPHFQRSHSDHYEQLGGTFQHDSHPEATIRHLLPRLLQEPSHPRLQIGKADNE